MFLFSVNYVYNGGMHICTMPAEGISFPLEMKC